MQPLEPDPTVGRFERIASHGFGCGHNTYAHSMAWFQDHLYVGTTVHTLCLVRAAPPKTPAALDPWPVPVPGDLFSLDLRAQIWRYSPDSARWQRAYISPIISGRGGKEVARDLGYRGMAVCRGDGEARPSLFVSAGSSASRGIGAHFLRSANGVDFEPWSVPGLGDPDVVSFRALAAFRGRLFTSPAGMARAWNVSSRPAVLECRDLDSGAWQEVSKPGFGDVENRSIFELEVFNGQLYAGTTNPKRGYEVWRTDAEGKPPYRWRRVVERGAYRGPLNEGVTSMCVHGDALYVGSGIQHGGYDRNFGVGPAAAEVIRIHPDDSWDLVVGSPRKTRKGFKAPSSGLGPGFNNFFIGYIWSMASYAGRLYVGTFDSSIFLRFATGERVTKWLRRVGAETVVGAEGGFDLWSSTDGVTWNLVTRTGFGNPYNYGARTMTASPAGLFVGTANPFGPEVAVRRGNGWQYELNTEGGLEVWMQRNGRVPS
ncbi:MAG: hypothetical protein MUE90_03350 [Thermoanaerobaculales bacterium]|jgi:hypothetical protein|nr:hypothetical protein [Thermoanaerobaculales bacterium]